MGPDARGRYKPTCSVSQLCLRNHRIIESFRLEKTFKIIESNCNLPAPVLSLGRQLQLHSSCSP